MTEAAFQRPVAPRPPRARLVPPPPNAWIPAALVLALAFVLASQLPTEALFFHAKRILPAPSPAAFVTLDDEAYAATMRSVQTAWQVGRRTPGALELDLGAAVLGAARPAPRFLARAPVAVVDAGQGGTSAFAPVSRPLVPPSLAAPTPDALPADPVGLDAALSPELLATGFVFPAPDVASLPTSRGGASFAVRTTRGGGVDTVLVLPGAPRAAADLLRRALMRGRASRATNGFIHIEWNRPSGSVPNTEKKGSIHD